jgi:hypothetical protein
VHRQSGSGGKPTASASLRTSSPATSCKKRASPGSGANGIVSVTGPILLSPAGACGAVRSSGCRARQSSHGARRGRSRGRRRRL